MKALVVYGTRGGATKEIADVIGDELGRQGYAVAVRNAKETRGIDVCEFNLVVVGSSVFMTMWKRQAKAFLKRNEKVLARKAGGAVLLGPRRRRPGAGRLCQRVHGEGGFEVPHD
ncbi:flavodoxin domain-containing protein [Methanocella sp. MCL-LM]|uniref:flavodoxin domain-containing protein n=1 Tax=Methanocella sp. MCL-LM TaxID=3412035 RepID=UPI003C77FA09